MSVFPTRILLAADGSAESHQAAQMACELSKNLGSELHLVHVWPVPSVYSTSPDWAIMAPDFEERVYELAEKETRPGLEEQVTRIEESGGTVAEAHLRLGRADAEIVSLAEELSAGLVVIGSRGLGAMKRALMGSVSTSVVRHAHCPVLVTRGGAPREGGLLTAGILVGLDGSIESAAAADAAAEIAHATGSRMHVTYACSVEPTPPYPHIYAMERWQSEIEQAKKEARTFIEEQAGRIGTETEMEVEPHLTFGEPAGDMIRLAEEVGARLIVTGSRGLGGIRRSLMGSVSDSVVRHAHCSVLVVRSSEGSGETSVSEPRMEGERDA